MIDYFIYYASSNIVGVLIFGVMLAHDRLSVDRQEKQLKYDQVLIAFMLYFLSDAIWSGVDAGVLPVNRFSVLATNFSNFLLYQQLQYYKKLLKITNLHQSYYQDLLFHHSFFHLTSL